MQTWFFLLEHNVPLATCHQGGIDCGTQPQSHGRLPTVSNSVHGEGCSSTPLGTLDNLPSPTKCNWHDVHPLRERQQLPQRHRPHCGTVHASGREQPRNRRCFMSRGGVAVCSCTAAPQEPAQQSCSGLASAPLCENEQSSIFTCKSRNFGNAIHNRRTQHATNKRKSAKGSSILCIKANVRCWRPLSSSCC